ncbi:hypothetical protein ACIREO_23190 [Streptomyces sp. NPDC102441]|uniref:hypothetical protein n=1 Tax=Streptomyces sp. NPDC102441 TaxID=3366176 RepID=UPI00382ACC5B
MSGHTGPALADLPTGVRIYQFISDRLEDRRIEQHPHGAQEYADTWRTAHDLDKDYANAVHGGDQDQAAHILRKLTEMADVWTSHPDHPAAPPVPPAA